MSTTKIIYTKGEGTLGAFGKLETPIKMIIEHESDLLTKKGGLADWLFNIEKSSRFGETIINNNEFDTFMYAKDGDPAEYDTVQETSRKFIEHIQFMKEFVITQSMMEDSITGVAADAKLRAQNFVRAYYKTMHSLASWALAHGDSKTGTFNNAGVDLSTGDGEALFSQAHKYGVDGDTQSNKLCGAFMTAGAIEDYIFAAANHLRNMKDENGLPLGYTADTIILPGNRPQLEKLVKKLCGSDGVLGSADNDVNLQYGGWHVVVDPFWLASEDEVRIMSSEANKNLRGNMLFNRVPLSVRTFIDDHTWDNCWSGRCRFGVGFGTYKHIVTLRNGASVDGYTALTV